MQTTPEEVLKEINRIFLKGNGGGKERQDQVLALLYEVMGLEKSEQLSLPLEAPKPSKTKKIEIAVDFTGFNFVPTDYRAMKIIKTVGGPPECHGTERFLTHFPCAGCDFRASCRQELDDTKVKS